MKLLKKIAFLSVLMLTAGCAGGASNSTVDALNKAQAVGAPFTKMLASEYRILANEKQSKSLDYSDALHFARKGLAAANGVVVMPEMIDDWDLGDRNLPELVQARAQLVNALENGGRTLASNRAAIAQARFDCWIEQQEESWAANVPCKTGFFTALKELNEQLGKNTEPGTPLAEQDFPAPIGADGTGMGGAGGSGKHGTVPLNQAMFIVFFDWDKHNITSSGNDVLDAVAQEIQSRRDVKKIVVVGHTDTSGSDKYNDKLSIKRAKAVQESLIARGLSKSMMRIEGRGKSDLLVKTADGVREPANRRAQITLE